MTKADEARQLWGKALDAIRSAREYSNAAWYQAEDKQAWIDEETNRLQALSKEVLKDVTNWKTRSKSDKKQDKEK